MFEHQDCTVASISKEGSNIIEAINSLKDEMIIEVRMMSHEMGRDLERSNYHFQSRIDMKLNEIISFNEASLPLLQQRIGNVERDLNGTLQRSYRQIIKLKEVLLDFDKRIEILERKVNRDRRAYSDLFCENNLKTGECLGRKVCFRSGMRQSNSSSEADDGRMIDRRFSKQSISTSDH